MTTPRQRKSRREFFNRHQTLENRIQLQRHARRKPDDESQTTWPKNADVESEVAENIKPPGGNTAGQSAVIARADHLHDLHLKADTALEFDADNLAHKVPAGGVDGQGNEDDYVKIVKQDTHKHATQLTFDAPAFLAKVVQGGGIDSLASGNVQEFTTDGSAIDGTFSAMNVSPLDANFDDFCRVSKDQNGNAFFFGEEVP